MPSHARTNVGGARTRSAAEKGAATVRRHQEERRAAELEHIHAQIADGTLVIRQMTVAQHDAALRAARSARARSDTRVQASRALRAVESAIADD